MGCVSEDVSKKKGWGANGKSMPLKGKKHSSIASLALRVCTERRGKMHHDCVGLTSSTSARGQRERMEREREGR